MSLQSQQEAFVAALTAPQASVALAVESLPGLQALPGLRRVMEPSAVLELGDVAPQPAAHAGLQRGLAAYRVNAQALADKALASVFPCVQSQLGGEAFAAMAWQFWRQFPPSQGDLAMWGAQLALFFSQQEDMDDWLVDLARLEWLTHQLERAADRAVDAASLQGLIELEPARLGLRLAPELQLLHVQCQAWQLWSQQQLQTSSVSAAASAPATLKPSVCVLLWRKSWQVQGRFVGSEEEAFIQALQAGLSLDAALAAAGPAFDFSMFLQGALRGELLQGAFDLTPASASA